MSEWPDERDLTPAHSAGGRADCGLRQRNKSQSRSSSRPDMPSHTYTDDDWRSKRLFGISIKFWQLSASGCEHSIVIPETAFVRPFLLNVLSRLQADLDLNQETVGAIANVLAEVLVKEEEANDADCARPPGGNEKSGCLKARTEAQTERKTANGCAEKARVPQKALAIKSGSKHCHSGDAHEARGSGRRRTQQHVRCPTCGVTLSCRKALSNHALIHADQKPFACAECGAAFRQRATRDRHAVAVHGRGGEVAFRCGVCGRGFALKQYLQRHERLHRGERPFVCHVCGRTFSHDANLGKHVRLRHDRTVNYVCEACGRTFVQEYYLRRHSLGKCAHSNVLSTSPRIRSQCSSDAEIAI